MRKRLLVYLWALIPVYAAQPVSNRYAVVLEDPPVSHFYQARAAMFSPAASTYRQRIRDSHAALRTEIASRGFHVTGEADTLLNAVFVTVPKERVAELADLAGVAGIVPLRSYKLNLNQALTLVDATGAWTALGGMSNAGLGIKIGILDTGIDQTHLAFQDAALVTPAGYPVCTGADCNFTSNKVIVARSYVKMLVAGTSSANPAADSRPDDTSPRDRTGHGTAVASIAAGNTTTGLVTITGMAPHAFLGNYRIFGSPGVNDTTTGDVIIAAAEDAIADGMDMISLSLGAPAFSGPLDTGATCQQTPGTPCDPLAYAMEAAAKSGMIVVVAAGNGGQTGTSTPGYNTISSPGDAPSVIAVGASTNSHIFPESVSVPGTTQNYLGYLGNGAVPASPVTAPGVDLTTLGSAPRLRRAAGRLPQRSHRPD
jgi:subtilisin family serine protease